MNGGSDELDVFGGLLEKNISHLTAKKLATSIPKSINKAIGMISLFPENVSPFGSWVYKSQLYPGDIDLIETDIETGKKSDVIDFYVKGLQKIISSLSRRKNTYIGDIKAGLDEIFMINIGHLRFDKNGNYDIIDYHPNEIKQKLHYLYNKELLSPEEIERLLPLVKNSPTVEDHDNLSDELREFWLLRWTPKEILKGFKILSGDRIFHLSKAIQQPTMTKIDMWYLLNDRWIEITNVFVFFIKNRNGQEELLNFANDIPNLDKALKKEIEKYAFHKKYFKPFKMVKRIWSLSRMKHYDTIIKNLTPLLQSDLGRLSQINSDIETMISMLETLKKPPLVSIRHEIDYLRYRLGNIYEIDWDEKAVDLSIIEAEKLKKTPHQRIEILKKLKKYFSDLIGSYTIDYLKKISLYPIPSELLP